MSDRAMTDPGSPADEQLMQNPVLSNAGALPQADRIRPADGYAGDVSPQLAWQWVQDGVAKIVDVRTDAEREWVGFVPGAVGLAWKQWPQMQPSPTFDAGLRQFDNTTRLLMLCRSGVRSIAAARRASELGLQAYNILEGFEGDRDSKGQRSHTSGWQFRGLPWSQN